MQGGRLGRCPLVWDNCHTDEGHWLRTMHPSAQARGGPWHKQGLAATPVARATTRRLRYPPLWHRTCKAAHIWAGHMAWVPHTNPCVANAHWRPPLWWQTRQQLPGPPKWRHNRTNWYRGPQDGTVASLGPQWPERAQDRADGQKSQSAFLGAPEEGGGWLVAPSGRAAAAVAISLPVAGRCGLFTTAQSSHVGSVGVRRACAPIPAPSVANRCQQKSPGLASVTDSMP